MDTQYLKHQLIKRHMFDAYNLDDTKSNYGG